MERVSTLLALAAAIFAGLSVYLTRKYHKISTSHAKSENIHIVIDASWILLSEFETIKSALLKKEQVGGKKVLQSLYNREKVIKNR